MNSIKVTITMTHKMSKISRQLYFWDIMVVDDRHLSFDYISCIFQQCILFCILSATAGGRPGVSAYCSGTAGRQYQGIKMCNRFLDYSFLLLVIRSNAEKCQVNHPVYLVRR